MYADNESEISFDLQQGETNIFLIVYGAPATHTTYVWETGYPKIKRYPYELKISNAVPEGYQSDDAFRSFLRTNGKKHTNGGGWVTTGTTIANTVYVGPKAIVRGGTYAGNVRIEGTAQVYNSNMKDNVIMRGNACINGGNFSGSAIVEDNAFIEACTMSGTALSKDNVFVFGVTYGGNVIMGGDSENGTCSNGVYLQFPHGNNGRTDCDGKGATDPSNTDINPTYTQFTDAQMAFSATPNCTTLTSDIVDFSSRNNQDVLFPNPFNQSFSVKTEGNLIYSIYDLAGIEQVKGEATKETMLGNQLSAGMYLVKISRHGRSVFFKASKQ